ncbi:Rpn family recombination-promoting nuclease/putative transposase [Pedobacter nutrimenti]|uniref:Rpn family recombination-promoting nuclease/putative transposase n=1 Tax=Pedobacter nutrimenti TaxID=1241337 RepID=UPI00292E4F8C|nr:Rpn family recombination-promoting nuclease/putative transposase [Pedobacter nutrimenti]
MTDKINGPEQGSLYDKLLRENMEETLPDIMKDVLHLRIVKSEEIPDDVQHTKERKPDLLKKVEDDKGNTFIVQIEYQRNNEKNLPFRMAEYSIMLQRKYGLPVIQFIIYIGAGKPKIQTEISNKYLHFWYNLVSLSEVDSQVFLNSDKIEQKMLAILGDFSTGDPELILQEIVQEIENRSNGELEEGRYLKQLRVLMQLRNLQKDSFNNMALTGKIFKEKKDILYIRGEINGKMETALEIAQELKKEGLSNEFIAKTTKLSVQEIEAL